MSKKLLYVIITILGFALFTNSVYAACSDMGELGYGLGVEQAETEEEQKKFDECRSQIENGFKCKVEFSKNDMATATGPYICKKSDQCAEEYYEYAGQCIKRDSGDAGEIETKCASYTVEEDCKTRMNCEWINGTCTTAYVAEDPCSEPDILKAFRFYGYLLIIAKVAIPLIIIVMGTFDLFKSVVDKDEKSLTKQVKILLMRVVAGIFIFFLPTIVYTIFDLSDDLSIVEDLKYKDCIDALLKPTGKGSCGLYKGESQCNAYEGCKWDKFSNSCKTYGETTYKLCESYGHDEKSCLENNECRFVNHRCTLK